MNRLILLQYPDVKFDTLLHLEKDDEKTRMWIYHSIYRNSWYKIYFFSILIFHIILLYSQPSSPDKLDDVCSLCC